MKRKFLRSDTRRHLRLGKKRRKLQVWRRPRGRHNKVRRKRFGYPVQPGVGSKSSRKTSGLINGKVPMLVHNLQELQKLTKQNSVIIARVGAKKKLDIIKKANEMKLEILNAGGTA